MYPDIQARTYEDYFSVILLCFYVPDYKSRHVSMFLTTKQDIFKTNGFPLKPYYFNIMAHWKILCFNKWQKHFNTSKCLVLLYNLFLVSIVSLHVSSKCILQYSTSKYFSNLQLLIRSLVILIVLTSSV